MLDMQVAVVAVRYENVHSCSEKKKVMVENWVLRLEMSVGCELIAQVERQVSCFCEV